MPKTKKVLKHQLDELEVSGARYTLCFEYYPGKTYSVAIYSRSRANLSDRVHNKRLWRLRPRRAKYAGFLMATSSGTLKSAVCDAKSFFSWLRIGREHADDLSDSGRLANQLAATQVLRRLSGHDLVLAYPVHTAAQVPAWRLR